MIKRWRLRNFKSFRDLPPLELAPINVLAGANSSGKSTIIQSILLLKQSLQYGAENRSIAFNGPLLRLGSFHDVRNSGALNEAIDIGFDIELEDRDAVGSGAIPWSRIMRRNLTTAERTIRTISLDLSYLVVNEQPNLFSLSSSTLTPALIDVDFKVGQVLDNNVNSSSYTRFNMKSTSPTMVEELQGANWLVYGVTLDQASTQEVTSDKPDAIISGGLISYFLPRWVFIYFNSSKRKAAAIANAICEPSRSFLSSVRKFDESVLPASVTAVVNDWLEKHDGQLLLQDEPVTVVQIRNQLEPFLRQINRIRNPFLPQPRPSTENVNELVGSIEQLQRGIEVELIKSTPEEFEYEAELPRALTSASDYIQEFFKTGIRYLGPLRDSPRPVYQLEALESTTNVGYRGEHTAAILDLNRNNVVVYHRPPSEQTEQDFLKTISPYSAPLHDAVIDWLTYLGVADEVATTDAGVFGNRLRVSTDGSGDLHDLTNVGVGVSQVLPIVVMALLSPPGSFLIFEQPELHLHPKVQARLADFFLALALDGKQTLLETHSEYLIDRLRLRVALSESDSIRQLINILFTEKDQGKTKLTPIELTEFGAVKNWPKDFFEQSQTDVNRIIRAAIEKQRKRSKL